MTRPTNLSDFDGYNFHVVPVSCAKCGKDGLVDLEIYWSGDYRIRPVARPPWYFSKPESWMDRSEIRCGECDEQTE